MFACAAALCREAGQARSLSHHQYAVKGGVVSSPSSTLWRSLGTHVLSCPYGAFFSFLTSIADWKDCSMPTLPFSAIQVLFFRSSLLSRSKQ